MQLGGRLDYGQPVRHDRTITRRTATREGTRQLKRFYPLGAMRQRNPTNRFECQRAWRLDAKNVLATPSTRWYSLETDAYTANI